MGIYDRDYSRQDDYGHRGYGAAPRSMVVTIILINVAVYVIQILTRGREILPGSGLHASGWFTNAFSLHGDLVTHPWQFYQLLTYGFLHSPDDLLHIVGNMLGFFFLGRVIEVFLGSRRFLIFYLTAIVLSGAFWLVTDMAAVGGGLLAHGPTPTLIGASGGVVAVIMLVVFYFPRQTVLLWFAIPIPLWALGLLIIVPDFLGATSRSGSNVAHTAHLGGAIYAFLFYKTGWSFERVLPRSFSLRSLSNWRRKSKLRVHRPPDPDEEQEKEEAVDKILRKIQEHGKDSLTRGEQRILEEASRRYQNRPR